MIEYITARNLAKKLGVRVTTLSRWRRCPTPTGPQGWIKYSATVVVYPADQVEKWLAEREKGRTVAA